ncbi:ABC transporter substrate-binding protein [Neobacillus cucumis]|uniref:ABC transporter substrate-binding protein n=1 Tax=Neobacillus cucumis TaxID=1740721 RepID=UPI00285331E6|nr:ABC transporter substrate-binding protein [Neobacillus cucumis]MDR4945224.1 ABC transporter substrate-binding protein [Neobacillus cucumis]
MKQNVKKMLAPLVAGSLIFSLAACSGNTSSTSKTESKGPVTITFSFDQGIGKPAQQIIDEYNASQNKVHVKTNILPQDANVVHDDFVNKLASGDKSVDVMALDVVYVSEFASAGWLTNLTKYFDKSTQDKYLPGTIDAATYKGKLVASPWFTNASALFYRKDVLDQLGVQPPTTYQGWMDLANKVNGVNGVQYLSDFQAAQSEALVCNWVEFVANNGGEVLNQSGKPVVNSEKNIQATQIMADLAKKYSPKGVTTYTEPESEQVFLDGKALFLRDWSGFWSQANREGSKVKDKVGVTTLPIGPDGSEPHSTLGGLDLVINKAIDEEHQKAAVDFIRYLSSEKAQKEFNLIAAQPPVLQSVYKDPEVLKVNPFYKDFYAIIMNGKARPMSPKYAKVSDAIQRNIHSALTGKVDVKDALDKTQKEIEELSK